MPRKTDPKASVLAYFATVSAEEARNTLALAKEILRQRTPKAKRPTNARRTQARFPAPAADEAPEHSSRV